MLDLVPLRKADAPLVDLRIDQLAALYHGQIVGFFTTPADRDGDQYYGLIVLQPTGRRVTVTFLADGEGNGPGAFEIAPLPFDEGRPA